MSFVEDIRELCNCLAHPCRQLVNFNAAKPAPKDVPYTLWTYLLLLAALGTVCYGASLGYIYSARFFNGLLLLAVTALLTFPTGFSWLIFGYFLAWLTRLHPLTCAYACLIDMACGGLVLLTVSFIHLVFGLLRPNFNTFAVICTFNEVFLIILDVGIAWLLILQLRALRVSAWKTFVAWMIVLNGSFALISTLLWTAALRTLDS